MIEQDKKIRKGLGPKREAPCFLVEREIVIPAGTLLRQADAKRGGAGHMECVVGLGESLVGYFVVEDRPGAILPATFKRVIST